MSYEIRKLKWKKDPVDKKIFSANTINGFYRIYKKSYDNSCDWEFTTSDSSVGSFMRNESESFEAAKRDCQEHWERQVRIYLVNRV